MVLFTLVLAAIIILWALMIAATVGNFARLTIKQLPLFLVSVFMLITCFFMIICCANIRDPANAEQRGSTLGLPTESGEQDFDAPMEPDGQDFDAWLQEERLVIGCIGEKVVEKWKWKVDDCLENPISYLQEKYPGKEVCDLGSYFVIVCNPDINEIELVTKQDLEEYCHEFTGKHYWNETVCVNEGIIRKVS